MTTINTIIKNEQEIMMICPYCGEPVGEDQIVKVGNRIQTCGSEGCQKEHEATRNRNKNEERRNKTGIYVSGRKNRNEVLKDRQKIKKRYSKDNPPPKELLCSREGCYGRKEESTLVYCADCEIEMFCGDDHPLREIYSELSGKKFDVDKFDNKKRRADSE